MKDTSLPNDSSLQALGASARDNRDRYTYDEINPGLLEFFAPAPEVNLVVEVTVDEFTSLCPVTGQPDYGTLTIHYSPRERCVESKSLKLYLMGYRSVGVFAERCAQIICAHLYQVLQPEHITVYSKFAARGGIACHGRAYMSQRRQAEAQPPATFDTVGEPL